MQSIAKLNLYNLQGKVKQGIAKLTLLFCRAMVEAEDACPAVQWRACMTG